MNDESMTKEQLLDELRALRESEAQKRAMLDGITINLAFVNENLEILWVNKASADSVNRNADEMIGHKCHEFWGDPNAPCDGCPTARAFKTKRTEQTIMHTPDGRVWDEKGEPVFDEKGELIGVLEIAHDITARARAEEALRESEEKYRHIFNNAQVGIFRTRINDGKVLECNDRFARTYGYETPEECMADFVVSEHYTDPGIREKMVATLMEKGEVDNQEARISRKDGEDVWVRFSARVYPGKGYLEGVGYEITEEKKALKALQESEERYRTLVDNLPVAVYRNTPGPKGAFLTANPAFCKMFGFKNEEEVKKIAPADLYEKPKEREQYSDNLIEKGVVENDERTLMKRDGTPVHTSITSRVVYGKDGEVSHFDSIMLDITEQKRLANQLQQAQKMEAVATLAGGVAHEFNNALMGIVGNLELLKMDLPEDEGRDKYFKAMKSASHRMSRLTDQLLAYAQGGKYQPKDLKLDDFVIQTLPILQHDLNSAIRVETHFSKDIPHIKADYTQMQMVLSAILANSNEAIEVKGCIRITAENKDLDEDFSKQHHGLKPGPYVCLTIEDDGKGMNEEERGKIFEPFFTTKFQGRGMGMAAVYGIVKNHDGWIYVDSELGKGTTVRIYLPATSAGSREGAKAVTQPEVELGIGEGTILVIEDEEVVIEVTQAMLERLGYRVMVARTGKDAIHITETFDGQIDLALLDIKLPDMEGGKVYPLIMKARPDLKVIVFSGYSIEGPARKILDAGAQDFIQKPFSLATLSEKLRKVLEAE